MDTIFESNKFDSLEIEQGDTTNGEAFVQKEKNKTIESQVRRAGDCNNLGQGCSSPSTKLWHCGNPPRERQAVKISGFAATGGLDWASTGKSHARDRCQKQ